MKLGSGSTLAIKNYCKVKAPTFVYVLLTQGVGEIVLFPFSLLW
jgi:hypothetical protein